MMNRRKALKTFMAIGAVSVIPKTLTANTSPEIQTHFIGLGNSGSNILEYFLKKNPKARFTCLTIQKPENAKPEIEYIQIPYSGIKMKDAQLHIPDEAYKILDSDDRFVLLAGLGGFIGSQLAVDFSLKLQASNKDFQTICSVPFKFEGKKRREDALKALNAINHLPQVKYLELDHLRQKYDDLVLSNCFERGDMEFWDTYKS